MHGPYGGQIGVAGPRMLMSGCVMHGGLGALMHVRRPTDLWPHPLCSRDETAKSTVQPSTLNGAVKCLRKFHAAGRARWTAGRVIMRLPFRKEGQSPRDYGGMPLAEGIRETYEAFRSLIHRGMLKLPEAA